MFTELFGMLDSVDVAGKGSKRKFRVNLNRNRIKSISAYSSNSIFYFPVGISDQATPEEAAMIVRLVEKMNASFVVACISLMPFHRVSADDQASIESYLSQFHQNMGISPGSGAVMQKLFGFVDTLEESATDEAADVAALQDFLMECWERSKKENSDFVKIVAETVSLNEMFNKDALDPRTRILMERTARIQKEMETWGFLGEATEDMFSDMNFDDDEDYDDDEPDDEDPEYDGIFDEMNEGTVRLAINQIKFSLESVSENKINSCKNLTRLRSYEAKLKTLKNKYIKYLNRYKKKYNENEKHGAKAKLNVRFGGIKIGNPKLFMQQYGELIKVINRRLKLCEKRRDELRKRRGDSEPTKEANEKNVPEHEPKAQEGEKLEESAIGDLNELDLKTVDYCIESIDKDLNAPDSEVFTLDEAMVEVQEDFLDQLERDNIELKKQVEKITKEASKWASRDKQRYKTDQAKIENLNDQIAKNNQMIGDLKRGKELSKVQMDILRAQMQEKDLKHQEELRKATNAPANEPWKDEDPDATVDATFQRGRSKNNINLGRVARTGKTDFRVFDKEVFTDMEMKKANDAIPTFTKATIGFVVDETEEVINRDILVGIKAYLHKIPSHEMITEVYNCVINHRKFLKFVKFITGEERSLADLLFGVRQLKVDATDNRSDAGRWRNALKKRRRWAKMTVPYLMKEYTPNGTVVMTMNEVEFIRSEYGVDVMNPDHVKILMDEDYLLAFIVIDQANEMVYVTYDGQGYNFQEYTYSMLERERQTSDRMMRELYRSFSY